MTAAKKLRGVGGGVAAGFNPETDITWHSLFWAEGTDFVAEGYSDTDPVDDWPNETGESDAVQASGTLQPLYDASHASFNSQPVIDFDGTDDYVRTADFSVAPTYPVTAVVIVRIETLHASARILDDNDSAGERIGILPTATVYRMNAGSYISGGTPDTDAHLHVCYFSNSTSDFYELDGVQIVSGQNAGAAEADGLTIGALSNGSTDFDGQIAFLGIYEGDITADGSWADFETWAEDHYGLTIA